MRGHLVEGSALLKTGSSDECGKSETSVFKIEQLSSLMTLGGLPSCARDLSGLYLSINHSNSFFLHLRSVCLSISLNPKRLPCSPSQAFFKKKNLNISPSSFNSLAVCLWHLFSPVNTCVSTLWRHQSNARTEKIWMYIYPQLKIVPNKYSIHSCLSNICNYRDQLF